MPNDPAIETLQTCCGIVGGGPAGMMLGFILARAGIEVVVLEKHADFLRDFRGDTIHPSTLELMRELGMLEEFLKRPHNEVGQLAFQFNDTHIPIADFSHLPTYCKFIAFMPQWDFLNFVVDQAKQFPKFHLRMESEVTELIKTGDRISGVRANTPRGKLEVRADLIIGADGRHSVVREKAGFKIEDLGAPMDVLWMRLSRRESDPKQSLGHVRSGAILIMVERGDYWQCGFVIGKGEFDKIRQNGLPAFQARIAEFAPALSERVKELDDWNKIKLLVVKVDRLSRWHAPGLLCIGDAAHAMSPIGGVGINLAIQDAVATANILAGPLGRGTMNEGHLRKVQQRRELPTRLTQRLQLFIQNRLVGPVLKNDKPVSPPIIFKLFQNWPWLRRMPARFIGLGFRPEHVRTAAVKSGQSARLDGIER